MVGTSFQKILPLNSENINAPLNDKQSILQIKEVADKEDKNAEIKEIQFSPDKKHFAATDNMGRIGLFRLEGVVWSLVARYHFKGQINILSFCFNEEGTRIYTITSDRYLEEFKLVGEGESYQNYSFPMNIPGNKVDNNINNNNINNANNTNNKSYISIKIEDDCNMTSIVWYPLSHQKEKEIVISNDAYKIKAVNVNDSLNNTNPLSIIKASLGPCFGGPIQVMRVIPGKDKTKRLIAFATREKVLGLMCLPIDGNPFRYMGVIAHPGIIKDVKPATNASYIFTTGGDDYTINIWRYNINPLIEAVENGGDGIKPFLNLLEGGKEGKKYKEMVDYFYYAQIKSKDENTTKHRVLDQTVAINCIHGLLASLGYYPSIEEINNIQREVRHMKHLENVKEKSDDITFETFVKIYLNHRPYIELDVDKIEDSFDNMKNQVKYHSIHDDNETIIVRERLIECLQEIKYEDKKKDDKGVVTVELKRKVDDATIEAIIKELDENSSEQPITSLEHYQKKISREKFLDLMELENIYFGKNETFDNYHKRYPKKLRRWPLCIFLISAILCLSFSTTFHLIGCISKKYHTILSRFDYGGISLLVSGSCFPPYYYFFYCETKFRLFYLMFISTFGLITFFLSLTNNFNSPKMREFRGKLFIIFGLCAGIPVIHMKLAGNKLRGYNPDIRFLFWYLGGITYIIGGIIYITRFPERKYPGKFDFFGSSHQLFHIFVVLAAYFHYLGSLDAYYSRFDNLC